MKKVFAMLMAAVMVAALFAGCGAGSADANTIKIGMTGPLTGDAAMPEIIKSSATNAQPCSTKPQSPTASSPGYTFP